MRQEPIAFQSAGVDSGHYPTLARGEDGEVDAPINPGYEAIVLDWPRRAVGSASASKNVR